MHGKSRKTNVQQLQSGQEITQLYTEINGLPKNQTGDKGPLGGEQQKACSFNKQSFRIGEARLTGKGTGGLTPKIEKISKLNGNPGCKCQARWQVPFRDLKETEYEREHQQGKTRVCNFLSRV